MSAARGESLASHRDGRGALPARRDDREPGPPPRVFCAVGWQYREYLSEEQRRRRGCIARRMQPDFHRGLLKSKEYSQPLADISDDIARSLRFEHNTPGLPVEILDVVGKGHAGDPTDGRQWNLEWITFHLTRDGAGDCQSRLPVVRAWRKDQRQAPATRLV